MARTRVWLSGTLIGVHCLSSLAHSIPQCPSYGLDFAGAGVNGSVMGMAAGAVGSPPVERLYAIGLFFGAGAVSAVRVAAWDGSDWSPLGSGIDGWPLSIASFDDGAGTQVYVGGSFTSAGGVTARNLARWNGVSWSTVGGDVDGPAGGGVLAMLAHDDGSGPALVVGGSISSVGGAAIEGIGRWNGASWSPLGSGLSGGSVQAVAAHDDGSGIALYAAGLFTNSGGAPMPGIARWDGSTWADVGGGLGGGSIRALVSYDEGSGAELYAFGSFTTAGGVPVTGMARWNGTAWSSFGGAANDLIYCAGALDLGAGPELYVGGEFGLIGGVAAAGIAKWSGGSWSALAPALGGWFGNAARVRSVALFDGGSGPALAVGGDFQRAGSSLVHNVALRRAAAWEGLGNGQPLDSPARTMLGLDLGSGSRLYAGGWFTQSASQALHFIGAWDGSSWQPLGAGVDSSVDCLAGYDDGGGPALYAGGTFSSAGGSPAASIARWNGSTWSPVGGGANSQVAALQVFEDGNGPALYAGGAFTIAGGTNASRIARWDGTQWSDVGGGIGGAFVAALAVFDDGTGAALFAGGHFSHAGFTPAPYLAKWDGSTWSSVGGGLNGAVNTLCVFDDGTGPALFAGGEFTAAGGAPATRIAKWDGLAWSALGSGVRNGVQNGGSVQDLTVFDDGSGTGPALYVAGDFRVAGGASARAIARWDGANWLEVGGGLGGPEMLSNSSSLAVFDDGVGDGPSLFLSGSFTQAGPILGGVPSYFFARWNGCGRPGIPYCFGDGTSGACPCANQGTPGHGCENSVGTGGAMLESSGGALLAQDSLSLTSGGEPPSALSILLQGNAAVAPLPFGDGLRCAGGTLKRLYVSNASSGVITLPGLGDATVAQRSSQLGDVIPPGGERFYQVYYRDPSPTFCAPPLGNTWNASNGIRLTWLP